MTLLDLWTRRILSLLLLVVQRGICKVAAGASRYARSVLAAADFVLDGAEGD